MRKKKKGKAKILKVGKMRKKYVSKKKKKLIGIPALFICYVFVNISKFGIKMTQFDSKMKILSKDSFYTLDFIKLGNTLKSSNLIQLSCHWTASSLKTKIQKRKFKEYLLFILIMSGDIELNPGPMNHLTYTPPQLENMDNICFANSAMQVLCSIPEFVDFVIGFDSSFSKLDESLKKLLTAMYESQNSRAIIDSAKYFKQLLSTFNWKLGNQQDVHEFMINLVSCSFNKNLSNIFEFELKTTITCHSIVCMNYNVNISSVKHNFMSLAIDGKKLKLKLKFLTWLIITLDKNI